MVWLTIIWLVVFHQPVGCETLRLTISTLVGDKKHSYSWSCTDMQAVLRKQLTEDVYLTYTIHEGAMNCDQCCFLEPVVSVSHYYTYAIRDGIYWDCRTAGRFRQNCFPNFLWLICMPLGPEALCFRVVLRLYVHVCIQVESFDQLAVDLYSQKSAFLLMKINPQQLLKMTIPKRHTSHECDSFILSGHCRMYTLVNFGGRSKRRT